VKPNDKTNGANEHNMVRNPNWQEADQLAISLQVIRNVFVATPVQVIFAWPAINSLYSYTSILLFLITTD